MNHKLVSWNINSINARLNRLIEYIETEQPDVVCLQETKATEERVPYDKLSSILDAGYNIVNVGQKSYNGVAILSRIPFEVKTDHFESMEPSKDFPFDDARIIEGIFEGFRVINCYVPNGRELNCPHYFFKLEWLRVLTKYLSSFNLSKEKVFVVGDFNVALNDDDVYDLEYWQDRLHFSDVERDALKSLLNTGFVDCFSEFRTSAHSFSWWHYMRQSFENDKGLRIDYSFASTAAADVVLDCFIDTSLRSQRQGSLLADNEKPSDHAAVVTIFSGV